MKKLKYLWLALLVAFLLAIPAAGQNKSEKGERNNNGTTNPKQTGQNRAEQVQMDNKKGDKDNKGGKKKKTRKGWDKTAKHHGSSK